MRILAARVESAFFDQGVPRGLPASLRDSHQATEARKLAWKEVSNGDLLKLAEDARFDLLLTTDENVRYQQNLAGRKLSLIILGQSPWWLVRRRLDAIIAAVEGGNSRQLSRSRYSPAA